jgi:hypothetical protein
MLMHKFEGKKLFILFPPSEYAKLYPPISQEKEEAFSSSSSSNSCTASCQILQNFSQVDLRTIHLPEEQEKFPLFKTARGYKTILNEGDMLFLPSCWYHFVVAEGDVNVNVNFWWLPKEQPPLPVGFPLINLRPQQQTGDQPEPSNKPPTPRPMQRPTKPQQKLFTSGTENCT